MSAKTSPARVAAFLRALAETGNQTIAAERARVSRSWVSLHQSTDPAFRARMIEAVAAAKARLRAEADGVKPAAGWGHQRGEELVVRGHYEGRTQIVRARPRQWTPRAEGRFLRVLSATANVQEACAAAGLTPASAYKHRERWPKFAAAWDAALEEGYLFLEAALLENAMNVFDPPGFAPDRPTPPSTPLTVDQAFYLLKLHRQRVPRDG